MTEHLDRARLAELAAKLEGEGPTDAEVGELDELDRQVSSDAAELQRSLDLAPDEAAARPIADELHALLDETDEAAAKVCLLDLEALSRSLGAAGCSHEHAELRARILKGRDDG